MAVGTLRVDRESMLPSLPVVPSRFHLGSGAIHHKATHGGLFIAKVAPVDDVAKGQQLADIVDLSAGARAQFWLERLS
jgi:predicted deacylase